MTALQNDYMKLRIKSTRLTLSIISWLEIIGGITGIGLIFYLLLRTGAVNGPLLLIFIVGLSLFSFSIYAGKQLLNDETAGKGIILSIINQILQLFQWSLFGFGLTYSSGAELIVGIQGLALKAHAALLFSSFEMSLFSSSEYFVKLNVLAVLILVTLFDILKERKNNQLGKTLLEPAEFSIEDVSKPESYV